MYVIYSAEWCGYCQKAKQLLKETNFNFEVIDIDEVEDARPYLKEQGLKTIPQIWHDDLHVGGYDDLVEYLDGTS